MTKAIRMHRTGGPEVMVWEDFDPGKPGPGQALIRHEAVGLNFIDIYHRSGLYPLPSLPATPGMEGAGIVEALGDGVTEVKVQDRVAYAGLPPGAYAEMRVIPAHRLVSLPEGIPTRQAAGMMLRGMTARYLLHGCFRVKRRGCHPDSRRCRRRRPHCLAVGQTPRGNRDRHRGFKGEGRTSASPWLRSHDPVRGGGFPRKGQGTDRRTRGGCGL